MSSGLSVRILDDEDAGTWHIEVKANNRLTSGVLDSYVRPDDLRDVSDRLRQAATTSTTAVIWEQGSPDPDEN